MRKMRMVQRAYLEGRIVEPGEVVDWQHDHTPACMVEAGSKPEPFGGKGDHDGDGKPGGSLPGEDSTVAKGRRKKGKAETVEAPTAQPFADAPAPQTVAEAQKAVGGMQPDWVSPDAGAAKPVAD